MLEEAAYSDFALDISPPEAETFAGRQPEPQPGTESEDLIDTTGTSPIVAVNMNNTDPNADHSRLIELPYDSHVKMSKFEQAIAIAAELGGVSRHFYNCLRESLSILRGRDGQTVPDVESLPQSLDALRKRMRKRLPLLNMREVDVPLRVEKMPTVAAQKKGEATESSKETSLIKSTLTFFDPLDVFTRLASSLRQQAYFGPALFVDEPSELYHSHAWASSVRTSGGKYPHLVLDDGRDGAVIFPSDFVYYTCATTGCACSDVGHGVSQSGGGFHIGRVYGFGYDRRTKPCTEDETNLVLQMQPCYLKDSPSLSPQRFEPALEERELVILGEEDQLVYVPQQKVFCHLEVFCNRHRGETHDDPSPASSKARSRTKLWTKYIPASDPEVTDKFIFQCWRVLFDKSVVPLCHTHPIRAELEIKVYSRELYETVWDQALVGAVPVVSIPHTTFIDGFGIYRNSYRSLMGMYVTFAGLDLKARCGAGGIFPLVLGPHGSNFSDVLAGMKTMASLDKGVLRQVGTQLTRVCAFSMAYSGDMPQQAENSGFKTSRAHKFCRVCFIGQRQAQGALNFDTIAHGRYHFQTLEMQQMMAHISSTSQRNAYGSRWGIANHAPPLQTISPALDLILSRPLDGAHSEYNGLSNLLHVLLCDGILTNTAKVEYARALRVWPFPPGANRLQSPIHHLSSYSMSDHARWAMIIPAFIEI